MECFSSKEKGKQMKKNQITSTKTKIDKNDDEICNEFHNKNNK